MFKWQNRNFCVSEDSEPSVLSKRERGRDEAFWTKFVRQAQELLREVKSSRHPVCPAHQPPLGSCYTLGPCPHIPQTQGEVSIPSFFSLTGFLNHPIIAPTHSVLIPTLSGLFFCVFSVGTFIRSIQVRLDDTLAEILTKGI